MGKVTVADEALAGSVWGSSEKAHLEARVERLMRERDEALGQVEKCSRQEATHVEAQALKVVFEFANPPWSVRRSPVYPDSKLYEICDADNNRLGWIFVDVEDGRRVVNAVNGAWAVLKEAEATGAKS